MHGIGQRRESADSLEARWLPSLAGGVRTAGFDAVADTLWRASRPGVRDVRMAFYGDLFRAADQQGDADELTDEQWAVAEPLAREWLARYAVEGVDREAAAQELAALAATGETQGLGAALRPVINALARLRPFARLGVAFAGRFVVTALREVTVYLTDEDVRERALAAVARHVGPETRAIVGHSLGSVVAYEAAHRLSRPLPLLTTLGSPLGLRSIVYERLRPQPPRVPDPVRRWVNIADRDDIVAAQPDLRRGFPGADGVLAPVTLVDNGAKPHDATFYLTAAATGAAVASVLA